MNESRSLQNIKSQNDTESNKKWIKYAMRQNMASQNKELIEMDLVNGTFPLEENTIWIPRKLDPQKLAPWNWKQKHQPSSNDLLFYTDSDIDESSVCEIWTVTKKKKNSKWRQWRI